MKKAMITLLVAAGTLFTAHAQQKWEGKVYETFYDSRIINGHSVEMEEKGILNFIIQHRFGRFNNDVLYNWLGLDNASIRLGLDYGISDRLNIGVGRSSQDKTIDAYVKGKLLHQGDGMPLSAVYFGSAAVRMLRVPEGSNHRFVHRLAYTHQILLARKFSEGFSLQLTPTFVHRNLVPTPQVSNNVVALGIAPRVKVSKNVALQAEYYQPVVGQLGPGVFPTVGLGVDIYTKGHLFQLHFTNAQGMNARSFVTETNGNFANGGFSFGFNIARTFRVGGRDY